MWGKGNGDVEMGGKIGENRDDGKVGNGEWEGGEG